MTTAGGRTALVYGIALAGDALAAQLVQRGWRVIVADDVATALAIFIGDFTRLERLR